MPTMAMRMQASATTATTDNDTTDETVDDTVVTEEIVEEEETYIEDKSSQFDDIVNSTGTDANAGADSLAAQIRAQRAALDAADAANTATLRTQGGANTCDANLRACMMEKCGKDFSKCAGDTDTLWGTKMDACRRDLPCTGEEYRLFSTEIKADRDLNAKISSYNSIIECGNRYNDCIISECGEKFNKCLGKTAGDNTISNCGKIARECTEMDSGLASRTMSVFGTLRVDAEKQVARDEERLYELRDLMRDTCNRLGAMFDERTLDCVYTVNFYAGEDNTLYASKKAYAGSTFDCDQNWFGVDITTFKENAFRLTREQKSASSALLGSGLGMGVGAITSGAIDRAVDRHTAERAVKKAEKEHEELYGTDTTESNAKSNNKTEKASKKAEKQAEQSATMQQQQRQKLEQDAKSTSQKSLDETIKKNALANQPKSLGNTTLPSQRNSAGSSGSSTGGSTDSSANDGAEQKKNNSTLTEDKEPMNYDCMYTALENNCKDITCKTKAGFPNMRQGVFGLTMPAAKEATIECCEYKNGKNDNSLKSDAEKCVNNNIQIKITNNLVPLN